MLLKLEKPQIMNNFLIHLSYQHKI
jgi:hypothetical protein